ncbi:hypothetical protein HUU51_02605 [Candidatus Gracilibacteria bacterium]|nr:hypothetical protein [Candidatus Gracilibacteria bacterium]
MIRNTILLIFISFFLFSCGSSSEVSESTLIKIENKNFNFNIPGNWEIIEDKENILPKAKEGVIELAATSKTVVSGFSNNILILSDDLKKLTTSKDYSILNNMGAETDYLEYKKISTKDIVFSDGEPSIVYEFEAKYNLDTPKLKFLQTASVCNKTKGYFITIALPTSVTDTSKYVELLSTFGCK